jgi:hypothetical protein
MKTISTTMKSDFVNFLDQLGIVWKYLINGLVGGAVWSIYKKSKLGEALRQVVVGGIISGYATAYIAEKTSPNAAGFISFVVGMIGMVLIEVLYKWGVGKLKLLFSNE